jgi:hypothetical protein
MDEAWEAGERVVCRWISLEGVWSLLVGSLELVPSGGAFCSAAAAYLFFVISC